MSAANIFALVLATVSLVVSVISLTWQIVSHRLTGSVVEVDLLAGALGHGGIVSSPLADGVQSMLAKQGFTVSLIGVRGRNVGRLAVDVSGWDVKTADGFGYSLPGFHINPSVPYRLEPGASVTFYCPMADVAGLLTAKAGIGTNDARVRGTLTLGTGRVAESRLKAFPRS